MKSGGVQRSMNRLLRLRFIRWLWARNVPLAALSTHLCRFSSSRSIWDEVWYCLASTALRGTYSVPVSSRMLHAIGRCPGENASRPRGVCAPLWWFLACRTSVSLSGEQDITPLLSWWDRQHLGLLGRYMGHDFLIACLNFRNKQAFVWGLARGLPPDGCDSIDKKDPRGFHVSRLQSDLHTPLWHAVQSLSLQETWWVEQLLSAGARWDFAGRGGESAAQRAQIDARGWSNWWTRKTLLTQDRSVKEDLSWTPKM